MKYLHGLVLFFAGACHNVTDSGPQSHQLMLPEVRVDSTFFVGDLLCRESVRQFYAQQNYNPFWSTGSILHPLTDSLIQCLKSLDRYGLLNEKYHLDEVQYLLKDTAASGRLQRIDVLLTDSYLALYSHLRRGILDPVSYQRRNLSAEADLEAISSLKGIRTESLKGSLARSEPVFLEYADLKNALSNLIAASTDTSRYARMQTLSVNMERWRWQKPWPRRYLLVNIPSYTLRVVEADSVWLETKVIVGKRETPTPLIESIINSFIIYPYWHVPRSILTKEILPNLQHDPLYLQRNNFEVLDKSGRVILADTIRWKRYNRDQLPFILRQREGSENSMGIIKFNFPNKYGVYLHDTNSKRLYELRRRDLSHGCVRVKDAVSLAHYMVREDDIYVSPEDLDQYLSLRQRLAIDLRKPIHLKLAYITAEVRNGQPVFYDDIYKKDSIMLQRLSPVRNEIQSSSAVQTGD